MGSPTTAPMRSLIATVAQTSILAGVIGHPVAAVVSIGKPIATYKHQPTSPRRHRGTQHIRTVAT